MQQINEDTAVDEAMREMIPVAIAALEGCGREDIDAVAFAVVVRACAAVAVRLLDGGPWRAHQLSTAGGHWSALNHCPVCGSPQRCEHSGDGG